MDLISHSGWPLLYAYINWHKEPPHGLKFKCGLAKQLLIRLRRLRGGKKWISPAHYFTNIFTLFLPGVILSLSPSMHIYFGAKSLNNYANACEAMHNTVWNRLGEKMDSLRTDGVSANSHLLWMQEDVSDRVRTWEAADMFFTPTPFVVLLWFLSICSRLVVINEWLYRSAYTLYFVFKRWQTSPSRHVSLDVKRCHWSPRNLLITAVC